MRQRMLLLTVLLATLVSGTAVAQGQIQARTVVRGTVGPRFTITLKTAAGQPVRSLKPGTYSFAIRDLSGIHNFHLSGPGVNKKTSVTATGSAIWTVALAKGTYRFVCDPHRAFMHGQFTVS